MASHPDVQGYFDEATNTVSYVVSGPATRICAIVDSVLDYDPSAGHTSFKSADKMIDHVGRHGLKLDWILETHVHADHLSAVPDQDGNVYLKVPLNRIWNSARRPAWPNN